LDTSVETAPGEHPVYHISPEIWQETMAKAFDSFIEFFEHYYEVPHSKSRTKRKSQKSRPAASAKREKRTGKAPSRKR
jgi:hypothetical protein